MDQGIRIAIMRLSHIFKRICAKVLDPVNIDTLK